MFRPGAPNVDTASVSFDDVDVDLSIVLVDDIVFDGDTCAIDNVDGANNVDGASMFRPGGPNVDTSSESFSDVVNDVDTASVELAGAVDTASVESVDAVDDVNGESAFSPGVCNVDTASV